MQERLFYFYYTSTRNYNMSCCHYSTREYGTINPDIHAMESR